MRICPPTLSLAILLAAAPTLAVERYEGLAFRVPAGTALAYREEHWRYEENGIATRLVLYRCPDGAAFARKLVRDRPSAIAPDFELYDARDGYREGVRTRGGRREVFRQDHARVPARWRVLTLPATAVVDAGFDALVRRDGMRLAPGAALSASFLLPARTALLPVQLRRLPADAGDQGDTVFAMRLDAWYGFAAPETRVRYRGRDGWLSRFDGIGSIRDARGRPLPVRIEFPDHLRAAAEPAGLTRALREPLDGRCTI
ncbi:hypothetical protein [Lysobacter solisilvae (ex Woo and Kim 2020)]|uniref:DUF3108 domain-containing protein n=1 Tax=Agrilutibacter terrestris TaxID=2865112 RepID=A0A7H0G0D6_9GAMM|nr:hypothetical protein [Lysobacter terrestris]QNP41752.1 hypothetical protein H8B22_05965 [Lysobacter terrestris]